MRKKLYSVGISYPKIVLAIIIMLTIVFALQLPKLRWETDARVYLPKGHPAILYDEKVDEIFGVKDSIIVGVVNEQDGVFNKETLERIQRITDKIVNLPGVQATQAVEVASLATATYFYGTESAMGAKPVMPIIPQTPEEMQALKARVYDNSDLFVGNIVSADGKAAMIRARLKEGMQHRYMTYFQVKGILAAESGEKVGGGWWNGKSDGDDGKWKGNKWSKPEGNAASGDASDTKPATESTLGDQSSKDFAASEFSAGAANGGGVSSTEKQADAGGDWQKWQNKTDDAPKEAAPAASVKTNDKFYLAGRPVIEVSSGLYAMEDMVVMIPLIVLVMAVVLFLVFRTLRGVLLPIAVMAISIVWTMGLMVLFNVPLYTISTMLPVILVAVGIGDAVHMLSTYYDTSLEDPHRGSEEIVSDTVNQMGGPLITTSVTTAIGFLSLGFAEMPPFKIFGVFAIVGILLSWVITMTLLPSVLTLLKPKVGGYFAKRRAMRVYNEQSRLAWLLTKQGEWISAHKKGALAILGVIVVGSFFGATRLYVDSSWMSDFREDSEIAQSTKMLNEKFAGTVYLNVVIEAKHKDAFKDPVLLKKMEALQDYVATLPSVGDSLSVVDYIKNMNMNLHVRDKAFNVIPDSQGQIAEYLHLISISGRPQQLDEVVDYDYQKGFISIILKTDHTKALKETIDAVNGFVGKEFTGLDVDVNLSGSGNNSYIWGKLLIDSQTNAIVLSKIGILIIASLIFLSLVAGIYIVVPVTLSTLMVAAFAGVLGIPLDVSTALAAGIAIGVGVDYAVHYVFRYRRERAAGKDYEAATLATLRSAGRTIVLNAFVVTAGFAVLFVSQFPPHIKLGYFVAAYMVLSCVVAVFVLPALFLMFKPKFADKSA